VKAGTAIAMSRIEKRQKLFRMKVPGKAVGGMYEDKAVLQAESRLAMRDRHCGACRNTGDARILVL
jgi:hypothetical protein